MILVPAPETFTRARHFPLFDGAPDAIAIQGEDGRHLLLQDPDGPHHLWLRGLSRRPATAALIPLDDDVLIRLSGLLRLRRRLLSQPSGPVPRAWTITGLFRQRLILMVRALDGHLGGATYREIAQVLHGPRAVAAYDWKVSPIRGQTIRLVRDAVATMNGRYRDLLRGRR